MIRLSAGDGPGAELGNMQPANTFIGKGGACWSATPRPVNYTPCFYMWGGRVECFITAPIIICGQVRATADRGTYGRGQFSKWTTSLSAKIKLVSASTVRDFNLIATNLQLSSVNYTSNYLLQHQIEMLAGESLFSKIIVLMIQKYQIRVEVVGLVFYFCGFYVCTHPGKFFSAPANLSTYS